MANARALCIEDQEKLLDILGSYFRNAAKYYPKPEDTGKTTYFSGVGMDFIFRSAVALVELQPASPLFSRHEDLLQSLATSLQDLHKNPATHSPPDYFFFALLLYVFCLLRFGSDEEVFRNEIGQNLILAILQYHAHAPQLRRDVEEGFYNAVYGFTFQQDWPIFVQRAKKLGVTTVSPPGAPLPTDPPSQALKYGEIQEETRHGLSSGDAIVNI